MTAASSSDAPVCRLRPIRVLLVGRDRRFLRTAAVLLTRRGCEVTVIERPSRLLDAVESQRTNVVVLDGTDSMSATARAVAALDALPAPVPSLVVCDGAGRDPLRQLQMLPKWGAFEEIVSGVERLYGGGGRVLELVRRLGLSGGARFAPPLASATVDRIDSPLDRVARLFDRRQGERAAPPAGRERRVGGGAETTAVVGGAHARAAALGRALAGDPEAERLALILLVARGMSGLWLQRRWRPEDMRVVLEEAAGIAGVPVDPFALAVSLYTLCDPSLLELPPALAIEAQLGLLRALGGLEDVSLWGRDSDGRMKCDVFVGPREPSRRAAAVARETLAARFQDPAGPQQLFGLAVMRWQRPYGALVARIPRADRERGLVLLDQAASMIGPMLERLSLLERSADRERSLVKASERRLTRLGFDLHDQPLQEVAALASEMRLFRGQLGSAKVREDLREILLGRVQDLEARLAALDGSLRALCHSLEPPGLLARSLTEALQHEVDAHAARTETDVALEVEGDFDPLTDSQRIALVRILQECLSNVREHSAAREVRVEMRSKVTHVELKVTDNGRGFDVDSTLLGSARRGRLGLVGVHERARLLGGTCEVTSRPGGPTAISVSLPRWEGAAAADGEARAS